MEDKEIDEAVDEIIFFVNGRKVSQLMYSYYASCKWNIFIGCVAIS